MGTIITLVTLNQNSEVISIKAAGLSAHQVLAPLLLSSIAVAAISFAFDERIVTRSTTALSEWQNVDYGPVPRDSGTKTKVWIREGGPIIRGGTCVGRGGRKSTGLNCSH